MSKFNSGDLAVVKTTGETCFVVTTNIEPACTRVVVNLPQLTKEHGIVHGQQLNFFEEELETQEERILRELELRAFELEAQENIREQIEMRRKAKSTEPPRMVQ